MLTNIKKYVLRKLYDYHARQSDYCYEQIDTSDEDSIRYWGGMAVEHSDKCLELRMKLKELEGP